MIRQPSFVTPDYADIIIEFTKNKKPHKLLDKVVFDPFTDGKCIQMLHVGSYDDEPVCFKIMEEYAEKIILS